MTPTLMWQRFRWRGHLVEVVQQWTDPYGCPMLRVANSDDEAIADGMPAEAFLAEAQAAP